MTALATHVTGLPVIPAVLERVASLERVSLRPESLLPCAKRRHLQWAPLAPGKDEKRQPICSRLDRR
jgi:hypothetical protein